jgi:hypothetical protein
MTTEHMVITEHGEPKHFCWAKSISWTAVIVGTLVAIGLAFLLNLFGIAIGLAAFKTTQDGISTIVAMFVSGWVAGYLGKSHFLNHPGRCYNHNLGTLYGFVTWCLALVVTILLVSSATKFVSGYYSALSDPSSIVIGTQLDTMSPIAVERKQSMQGSRFNSQQMVDKEKAAHELGMTLFATFALFFIGAISSCFGGYLGFCLCHHKDETYIEMEKRKKMKNAL